MKTDHIHTIDTVNGSRYVHRTQEEVVQYIGAVGNWGLKTWDCSDLKCLEDEAEIEAAFASVAFRSYERL